jgi:antirestriction protein ArdC
MIERDAPRPEPTSLVPPTQDADPRVQVALDKLDAGFDQIANSDQFRSYLQAMSRFHHYSPNNVMLILLQRPDAERVAGFNTWKDLGRHIRKGEKGITIITPRFAYVWAEDEDTGQKKRLERLVGFGTGTVFDVKQTDGKPLPQPLGAYTLRSESEIAKQAYSMLSNLAIDAGASSVTRQAHQTLNGANGYYLPYNDSIVVSDDLKSDAAAKTLAHEVAHFTAGHKGFDRKADIETVAEASAFVVMHYLGIDTSSYSFPYIAGWAQEKEVFQRNLSAVQKTSHTVITGMERIQAHPPRTQIILFQRP